MKELYGDLPAHALALLKGKKDQFVGKVKERYGDAKAAEAKAHVDKWETECNTKTTTTTDRTDRAA